MSDIRKDFEAEFGTEPWFIFAANKDGYADIATNVAFIAYQAGRAHDVDVLIAEICRESIHDGDGEYYLKTYEITEIIRKHFGKE